MRAAAAKTPELRTFAYVSFVAGIITFLKYSSDLKFLLKLLFHLI